MTTSSAWASRTSSTSVSTACACKRFTVGGEAKGMTTPGEFRREHAGRSRIRRIHAHGRRASRGARPGEGRRCTRSACRSSGDSGSRKACCSRRRPASAARPTSTTTAILPWRSCRLAVRIGGSLRARATRRAAARCSSAVRRTRAAKSRARDRFCRRSPRAPIGGPSPSSDVQTLLGFYKAGRAEGGFDAGIQRGIERILAAPSFLFRIEREPARRRGRLRLSPQRSRPGVAAVVLSVEQHPGRRAASGGGSRNAERSGGAGAAGAAHASRSAVEGAGRQFRQPVARAEQARRRRARHGAVSGIRREPARRDGAGDAGCLSAARCTTTAASWSC